LSSGAAAVALLPMRVLAQSISVARQLVDALLGLRVTEEEETEGLDINQHDERGYIL
jgi:ammonia channel protein AmtB